MEYYFAVGSEQRGPHRLEELSSMGLEPQTLVWHDGLSEWAPASALPEFATLFAARQSQAPAAPIPLAVAPLAYQLPGAGVGSPNGMAIASLVLGIVSLTTILCYGAGFIPGTLAIIFGAMARKQTLRDNSGGRGIATAGLICGSISVGLIVLLVVSIIVFAIVARNFR